MASTSVLFRIYCACRRAVPSNWTLCWQLAATSGRRWCITHAAARQCVLHGPQERCIAAQDRAGGAEAREAALAEEKAQLKAGMKVAFARQGELEESLAGLQAEAADLREQVCAVHACVLLSRAPCVSGKPAEAADGWGSSAMLQSHVTLLAVTFSTVTRMARKRARGTGGIALSLRTNA